MGDAELTRLSVLRAVKKDSALWNLAEIPFPKMTTGMK